MKNSWNSNAACCVCALVCTHCFAVLVYAAFFVNRPVCRGSRQAPLIQSGKHACAFRFFSFLNWKEGFS